MARAKKVPRVPADEPGMMDAFHRMSREDRASYLDSRPCKVPKPTKKRVPGEGDPPTKGRKGKSKGKGKGEGECDDSEKE